MSTVTLSGLAISRLGLDDAVAACRARIADQRGGYACFVNVHTLTEATRHAALREALAGATFRFADGVPLLWLARAKRAAIATRVCGPDVMAALLEHERGRVHGFIGGVPGTGETIARRFGVTAVCTAPPVEDFAPARALAAWQAFLDRCPDRVPPAIVWVGLGAPKQERWLATVSPLAPRVMFFGVGAAFDFLAGTVPRAPRALQRLGLEWTHRLAHSPRRMWRRYLTANARFVPLIVGELTDAQRSRSRHH
jgi:N-acetylglucosaminyldiphosphoundecaprenol N-acetyl-beta-D-mannosaminyltransferase